jgi:hypothetical protein
MTARRRPPKEPGPTEPKNGDHWADVVLEKLHGQTVAFEQMRGQMVVLEQMRGQLDVVVERLNDTPTRGEFMGVVTHIENLGGRMGLFEDVLRQTRRELGESRRELGETRKELGETRKELGGRLDGVDSRLAGLEHEVRGVRQDVMRQAQGSELRALDQRMTVVERHLGL